MNHKSRLLQIVRFWDISVNINVGFGVYLLILMYLFLPININAQCNTPVNVTVTNIDYTNITLQWSNNPNALYYEVRIKPTGTATWETADVFSNSAVFYTAPCTSYELQVRSVCVDEVVSLYSSSFFVTSGGCSDPYC